jgi:hypothetical protein
MIYTVTILALALAAQAAPAGNVIGSMYKSTLLFFVLELPLRKSQ